MSKQGVEGAARKPVGEVRAIARTPGDKKAFRRERAVGQREGDIRQGVDVVHKATNGS